MDGASDHLPRPSDLSASVVRFFSEVFRSRDDLSRSQAVESELTDRCANLEATLSDLGGRISDIIHSYAVRSEEVSAALGGFRDGLVGLRSSVSGPGSGNSDTDTDTATDI